MWSATPSDWPLGVVDASSDAASPEQFHKSLEEVALTVKTCYWYILLLYESVVCVCLVNRARVVDG